MLRSLYILACLPLLLAGCGTDDRRAGGSDGGSAGGAAGGGEGEGEIGGEGEGEGEEGEGEEGEGEEGEGEGEPPACGALSGSVCVAAPGCFLEMWVESAYRCRPARGACEPITAFRECAAQEGCEWMSGDCFCEGDTPCACGDGPPQGCRDKVAGCAVRVASIVSGGFCRDGGCRRELQVLGGDHLVADDEEPAPPSYGMLSDDVGGGDSTNSINRAVIDAALGELASMALEDGYGDCCNAEFDGSDQYIQLYEEGAEAPREVRISDPEQAPEALRRLAELLDSLAYRLIQSDVEGLRCEEPR